MRKKTHQEFLEEVNNPHVVIIGQYVKEDVKIECECVYCHKHYFANPRDILEGKKCYVCAKRTNGHKSRKDHNTFIDEMKNINQNIEIVGKYIHAKMPIKCRCLLHDEIFFSSPTHLLHGQSGCGQCIYDRTAGLLKKTNEQFTKELKEINPAITPLEDYNGANKKITFLCGKCNRTWRAVPTSILAGYGCPFCNESHGEQEIAKHLDNNEIVYERQKKFPDKLRGVGNLPLSYDFYIPAFNLLIEYQGEFHEYGKTKGLQTEEMYNKQHEHDKRKRDFAIENNYNFLEIWYNDKNRIPEIMDRELDKYKNPVTTTA